MGIIHLYLFVFATKRQINSVKLIPRNKRNKKLIDFMPQWLLLHKIKDGGAYDFPDGLRGCNNISSFILQTWRTDLFKCKKECSCVLFCLEILLITNTFIIKFDCKTDENEFISHCCRKFQQIGGLGEGQTSANI